MSSYDYKTLSLPRLLKGPRARRQSAGDFVAGVIESALNGEQAQGWEFMGAQEFTTPNRSGLFGRVEPTDFIVLIFRRPKESAESRLRGAEARSAAPASYPDAYEEPRLPRSPPRSAPAATTPDPQPNVTPYPPRAPSAAPMFRGAAARPAPVDPAAATPRAPSTGASSGRETPRLDDDFGKI